jgi:hypothetical protein
MEELSNISFEFNELEPNDQVQTANLINVVGNESIFIHGSLKTLSDFDTYYVEITSDCYIYVGITLIDDTINQSEYSQIVLHDIDYNALTSSIYNNEYNVNSIYVYIPKGTYYLSVYQNSPSSYAWNDTEYLMNLQTND